MGTTTITSQWTCNKTLILKTVLASLPNAEAAVSKTMASARNRQFTILPKYVRVERDSQRVLWFIEMLTVY